MSDRFYVKPRGGLRYETVAEWLNARGGSSEGLKKQELRCGDRTVTDLLELTITEVEALLATEYVKMIEVFRETPDGHVTLYSGFPCWSAGR